MLEVGGNTGDFDDDEGGGLVSNLFGSFFYSSFLTNMAASSLILMWLYLLYLSTVEVPSIQYRHKIYDIMIISLLVIDGFPPFCICT